MTEVASHIIHSEDPRLDWSPQHDPASESYPIRGIVGEVEERVRHWTAGPVLDQGNEGACVGFGWTAELLASPKPQRMVSQEQGNKVSHYIYNEAKKIDEWPGEQYSGTSVLAGAKVTHSMGYVGEYRWCFSIEDVRDAIIAEGPVVVGIPWYAGMYSTRPSGLVEVFGTVVGGHCITITGYNPSMRIRGEDWTKRYRVFRWRNSWGSSYGVGGSGLIRYEDLRDLLKDWGEACVPMDRRRVDLTGKI